MYYYYLSNACGSVPVLKIAKKKNYCRLKVAMSILILEIYFRFRKNSDRLNLTFFFYLKKVLTRGFFQV